MTAQRRWIQAATVAVDDQTGALLVGTVGELQLKRAVLSASSADAAGNVIIPAVADARLCVLAMCLLAEEAVDLTFFSGPAHTGTALSGAMPIGDRGGFMLPMPTDPSVPWLETQPGEPLVILLSHAWRIGGWVIYREVVA